MPGFVRNYEPSDFERVKEIHEAQKLDFSLPDLNSALFIVKQVFECDGRVVAAAFLRIEAEAYLLLDKGDWGDAVDKFNAIKSVQSAGLEDAWTKGIDNCVCWVPKEVNATFAKRLIELGWTQDREGWITWSRPTR